MKALFVISSAPYKSICSQETIDALLTASAFGYEVQILFTDTGILHLLKNQQAEILEKKQFTDVLTGLDWYDINSCYVDGQALQDYGLTQSDLIAPCQAIKQAEIKTLMHTQSLIIHG